MCASCAQLDHIVQHSTDPLILQISLAMQILSTGEEE